MLRPSTAPTRPLLRLFPVLLFNLVAFGVAIPILPALVIDLGGSGSDVGWIFALQAIGQFAMAPVWGAISDRLGRKPVLLMTIAGAALADLLTAVAPALWAVYAARLVAGLCAGNIAAASALIADATDARSRSKGMALIGIGFGLGFTIGPALGGIISHVVEGGPPAWMAVEPIVELAALGHFDSRLPFVVACAVNIGVVALALAILREVVQDADRRGARRTPRRPADLVESLRRRPVRLMCGFFLAYSIAVTILESTFFLYMSALYGYGKTEVGMMFAAMGLLMAFVQGGGVGPTSRRLGDRKMTALGALLLAVGLALAPLYEPLWFLAIFLVLATVGRGLLHPGAMSMTSSLAREGTETGRIMGMLQSSNSLGRIIGPAVGGLVFDHVAERGPFVLAGVLLAAVALAWWRATATVPELGGEA